MKQTAVEWLDRWFRDNPEATHEEGNKALQQAKEMEKQQMNLSEIKGISNTINYKNSLTEISDEEIEKEAEKITNIGNRREYWQDGAKWYREQLKQRQ